MVHAARWAYARRYFVDAFKHNKNDAAPISIVESMDKPFPLTLKRATPQGRGLTLRLGTSINRASGAWEARCESATTP